MKILLLTNKSPWPPKDGGSAAALSMINGLSSAGASVSVLSFNTRKHHFNGQPVHANNTSCHFVDIDTGIKPARLLLNFFFSPSPFNLSRFISEDYRKELIRLCRENFDIIQIEGLAMASYLSCIREHATAKVVYRPHNIENIIWSELAAEERNILKKIYFRVTALKTRRIEKNTSSSFDSIAAMTADDMNWFIRNGYGKPYIISSPVPETEEISPEKTIPLSVCYIGALDWRPNINGLRWLVREVWPLVLEKQPDATLHIAGRNPGEKIRRLCRGRNIIFTGETESSARFISDKELLVVPLFSGSGIRMKILEGMSLGKCIVATPRAADGIISDDTKNIFIAHNARSFAGLVSSLLQNGELRNETGMNARENVRKNYNIFASAKELINFYTRLA